MSKEGRHSLPAGIPRLQPWNEEKAPPPGSTCPPLPQRGRGVGGEGLEAVSIYLNFLWPLPDSDPLAEPGSRRWAEYPT